MPIFLTKRGQLARQPNIESGGFDFSKPPPIGGKDFMASLFSARRLFRFL